MKKTYKDWPEELYFAIDKFTSKMHHYGFVTDYDQVFEQLGLAILVLQHKLPHASLEDLMGATLMGEIFDLPHKVRKEELKRLSNLYASYLKARKEARLKAERRAARKVKERHKGTPRKKEGKGKRA